MVEAVKLAFPQGIDWNVPVDIRQVILDQHYSPRKTRAYLRELERMGAVDGRFLIGQQVKAFIKPECYADHSKEPRTIQCLPIRDRIIALYYFKAISDAFFANHEVNIKHLPAA